MARTLDKLEKADLVNGSRPVNERSSQSHFMASSEFMACSEEDNKSNPRLTDCFTNCFTNFVVTANSHSAVSHLRHAKHHAMHANSFQTEYQAPIARVIRRDCLQPFERERSAVDMFRTRSISVADRRCVLEQDQSYPIKCVLHSWLNSTTNPTGTASSSPMLVRQIPPNARRAAQKFVTRRARRLGNFLHDRQSTLRWR